MSLPVVFAGMVKSWLVVPPLQSVLDNEPTSGLLVIVHVSAPLTDADTVSVPPSDVSVVGLGVIEFIVGARTVAGGCVTVSEAEAVPVPSALVASSSKVCVIGVAPRFAAIGPKS
jgi:hypothetical protein